VGRGDVCRNEWCASLEDGVNDTRVHRASPLAGELAQSLGVLIILAALVWGFIEGARLYSALILLGFVWFFFGRWLRHRNGIQ